jgi:7-carboxy-7-deazaguanine synthase
MASTDTDFEKTLPICELFVSIQGEGKFSGIPHFVVRFTGCNLNCAFSESVCDTAYASWNPEKGNHTMTDIANLVNEHPLVTHSFITGGEPSLHGESFLKVVEFLKSRGLFVAIETNGTVYERIFDRRLRGVLDFVTMSPKLSNSVPKPGTFAKSPWVNRLITLEDADLQNNRRSNYQNMLRWIRTYAYQVKFVVSDESQMEEIRNVIKILGVPACNVYLMPEGDTAEILSHRRELVINLCIANGFNYTDRLHILAWGNRRGV